MSRLADGVIPKLSPDWELPEWDVPPSVGIAGGLIALAGLGYVMYRFLNKDEEEEEE